MLLVGDCVTLQRQKLRNCSIMVNRMGIGEVDYETGCK